jgi:hypothetical protein
MNAHEKAAGVLDTPTTASKNHYTTIVASAEVDSKTYQTLQANFALLGHVLQHNRRAGDGRCTYIVERWGQARYFTHLHDVVAFLTQIGGAK